MSDPEVSLHVTSPKRHRFLFLDALRGIAAALIVVHHAPAYLGRLLPGYHAFLAVDLFFVLSGFVIGFSYENRLEHSFRFRDFVAARVIRLYPVYIMATLFSLALLIVVGHGASTLHWHVVLFGVFLLPDMFASVTPSLFPLDGPAWSLFLEVVANFAYAALVCRRLAANALLLMISFSSFALLGWWAVRTSHSVDLGPTRNEILAGLARIGYSFFIGVLAFRLYRRGWGQTYIQRFGGFAAAGVVVAIALALTTNLTASVYMQLLAIGLLFPVLLYVGACVRLSPKWAGTCIFLGEASYPLYLIHMPFLSLLASKTMKRAISGHALAGALIIMLTVAALLVLSSWLGRHVDEPARRWLTRGYNNWKVEQVAD